MKALVYTNSENKNFDIKGIETLNGFEMLSIRGGVDKPRTKEIDVYTTRED